MRWMRLRARGWAAGLGLVAALGFAGAAGAEDEPCDCSVRNQRVGPGVSCIIVDLNAACPRSTVRNACGVPVLLVDWPLNNDRCQSTPCTVELQPFDEAAFSFYDPVIQGESTFTEASYQVKIGDAEPQTLTVSGDVTCVSLWREEKPEGCAAAPGALAALGVLLLTVPVARWRRRA
ncbi:MXAN_0125 family MYXO-CTERM protein [Pyxidicoccus caerfyrddinensis]|uniref:MXAN_0125 family MYXO-CTERM protein n=1 Tax=Pyxidicoccus caerfyrddinensis TaxID=2709663 RepID=UPI0013DBBAB6|nr:MXAN_0125 family MYXO-CTERM protein [Pyxidicoccus caerfyrddinensis]